MVADIAYQNPDLVYDLLFRVTAQTLRIIAADPKHLGARIGVTAVLHTWGSALTHHPHLHCIVPGGGLDPDGRWKPCKRGFFLPVRVLSRLFRRLFLEQLIALHSQLRFYGSLDHLADVKAFQSALDPARKTEWVVYAKRPFRGPVAVLEYLSRYTHRVAISNSRIIDYDNHTVTFKWKDYRVKGHQRFKTMQLSTDEFIRRFLIHVLPARFHRIRHFGLFSNQQRKQNLRVIRQLLGKDDATQSVQKKSTSQEQEIKPSSFVCRICGTSLVIIETLQPAYPSRGPPG
jgi:hypothetical protein